MTDIKYPGDIIEVMTVGCIEVTTDLKQTQITFTFDVDDELEKESWQHTFSVAMRVCERCEGRGTITNPNIDGNGISQEEFDEDPDFREAYFSGIYDIGCPECNGLRVRPWVNEQFLGEQQKKDWQKVQQLLDEAGRIDAEYDAMAEAERRFGC